MTRNTSKEFQTKYNANYYEGDDSNCLILKYNHCMYNGDQIIIITQCHVDRVYSGYTMYMYVRSFQNGIDIVYMKRLNGNYLPPPSTRVSGREGGREGKE